MRFEGMKRRGCRAIQEELAPLLRGEIREVPVPKISVRLFQIGLSERFLRNYLRSFLPTLQIKQGFVIPGHSFVPGTIDPLVAQEQAEKEREEESLRETNLERSKTLERKEAAQKRLKELEAEYDRLKEGGKI